MSAKRRICAAFAIAMVLPLAAQALTIRSEGVAGCLVVDQETSAGPDAMDRNVGLTSDCTDAGNWAANLDGVDRVSADFDIGQMCLSVDFRRSLQGQGQTFNVFAAAECDKALLWEVRHGFIVAEIAATVYCLEASPDPNGGPSNAIARIGCSGADDSFWTVQENL